MWSGWVFVNRIRNQHKKNIFISESYNTLTNPQHVSTKSFSNGVKLPSSRQILRSNIEDL